MTGQRGCTGSGAGVRWQWRRATSWPGMRPLIGQCCQCLPLIGQCCQYSLLIGQYCQYFLLFVQGQQQLDAVQAHQGQAAVRRHSGGRRQHPLEPVQQQGGAFRLPRHEEDRVPGGERGRQDHGQEQDQQGELAD